MSARLRLVKPQRRRSGAPSGPDPAAVKDRALLSMELVDDMEDWLMESARMRRILQCPLVIPRWRLRSDARNPEGRTELGLLVKEIPIYVSNFEILIARLRAAESVAASVLAETAPIACPDGVGRAITA